MIEDQSTFDEIVSVVAGGGQAPAIAKRIAQIIRQSRAYGSVSIYAVTETEIVALGWTGSEEPAHMRFAVTKGLTGVVVKQRAPLVIGNVSKDPRYLVAYTKMRSEMIVPALGAGEWPSGRSTSTASGKTHLARRTCDSSNSARRKWRRCSECRGFRSCGAQL